MKLLFEKVYPYLIALLAANLWRLSDIVFPDDNSLLSSTLSVSGIFVGFLATSKAILLSMDSPVIIRLKDSGYIQELVSYLGQAIWLNLAFCVFNIIGFFNNTSALWFSFGWILLSVASLLAFIRITHVMLQIFKNSQ